MARTFAMKEYGIELKETGNKEIPFMCESGCVVAPHLRPICTIHVCNVSLEYLIKRNELLDEADLQGKLPMDITGNPLR
jgi:hypothetical protein